MRHIITLLLMLPLLADAQIYIDSYRFGIPPVPGLLLDSFPNAAAAYSLRKLDNDYTGNCIQVRRSSDNTTSNIGFLGNHLDTASLKTFCNATNCFVRTWYDQSGNANDALSTVDSMQPRIVLSGTIDRFNLMPTLTFNNDSLRVPPSIFPNIGQLYIVTACSVFTRTGERHLYFGSTNTGSTTTRIAFVSTRSANANNAVVAGRRLNGDAFQVIEVDTLTSAVFSGYWDYANAELYARKNGTQYQRSGGFQTAGNLENNQPLSSSIGKIPAANVEPYDGTISEMIFYTTNQLSNRAAIETNINTFYSIY
jgi:hypothetical protein